PPRRRRAELLEAIAVVAVLRVAGLALPGRLCLAQRLGVVVVALDLVVRRSEVEARVRGVVEVLLLERLERRRVAHLARLDPEQMPVVRTLVAAAVPAVVGLLEREVEHALGV